MSFIPNIMHGKQKSCNTFCEPKDTKFICPLYVFFTSVGQCVVSLSTFNFSSKGIGGRRKDDKVNNPQCSHSLYP